MHHANDNTPRQTIPLLTRLRRVGRQADIDRLVHLAIPAESPVASNDDIPDGFGIDTVFEIRPSEHEIERACAKQDEHGIGLRFDKQGRITHWRVTDKDGDPVLDDDGEEKWFKAYERYRQSKGSRKVTLKKLTQDSARHLSLSGCGGFPASLPYAASQSDGVAYWRMRHAAICMAMTGENLNARVEIDRLGVGSRVSYAEARANAGLPPAARGPKVVARGAGFLAGKVAKNDMATEGSFVGAPDAAENMMIAAIDAPRTAAALGDHAAVLADSLDGMTAREIAAKRGWGNTKSAEQRAVRSQDRALAALSEVQRKAA